MYGRNFTRVSGATLFEENEEIYIIVSFGDEEVHQQGAYVFKFDNIAEASLVKNRRGQPELIQKIDPLLRKRELGPHGAGQSAYHPALQYSGVLMSHMTTGGAPTFQIHASHEQIQQKKRRFWQRK